MFQRSSAIIRRKNPFRSAGFTLIEVIMSLLILSIISVITIDTLVNSVTILIKYQEVKERVYGVTFALKRMLKDFRYIKRGEFVLADPKRVNFRDSFGRDMYYRLNTSNGSIEIQIDGGNFYPLAQGISDLEFSYFDKNNTELVSPVPPGNFADIQWIEIKISGAFEGKIEVFPREMFR